MRLGSLSTLEMMLAPELVLRKGRESELEGNPLDQLSHLVGGFWISGALYVITKLGVADCLDEGPLRSETLALMTETHAPSLYRVLRALASVGVFQEDENGYFSLTAVGQLLRSDKLYSRRSVVLGELGGASVQAWEDVLYSVKTGKPAKRASRPVSFEQSGRSSRDELQTEEELLGGAAARLRAAILRSYDFSRVKTIVDIGGGDGVFLAFLLQAYEPLHGVVFDHPRATATASLCLAAEGVAKRCQIVTGDVLEAVPNGYELSLLREVMRNYKDAHVVKILRNCHRAMLPHGKLLIIESLASEGNHPSLTKLRDLKLLISSEGRERTEAEFRSLLRKAGLRLMRILPTSAEHCILEVGRR